MRRSARWARDPRVPATVARLTPDDLDRLSVSAPGFRRPRSGPSSRPSSGPARGGPRSAARRRLRRPDSGRSTPSRWRPRPRTATHSCSSRSRSTTSRTPTCCRRDAPGLGGGRRPAAVRSERARGARADRAVPSRDSHEGEALARGWAALGITDDPWPGTRGSTTTPRSRSRRPSPGGTRPRRRTSPACPRGAPRTSEAAFARTAHAITLRPVFSAPEFARLRTAWASIGFGPREREPVTTVRRARA